MQRFYFDLALGKDIFIEDKDFFNQISHTLRSKIGDRVILFNWDSNEYLYEIVSISNKWVSLILKEKTLNEADKNVSITIYQALPNKYEKIEYIIQKWVEVWISKFVFYKSERSSKLAINDNKIKRFNLIMKESLEQCWGNKMPKLNFIDKIDYSRLDWKSIVWSTKSSSNGSLSIFNENKINIFIWPEWGFSENELEVFEKNNFEFVNFWKRILRTETMSSVLSFMILNAWI